MKKQTTPARIPTNPEQPARDLRALDTDKLRQVTGGNQPPGVKDHSI